MSWSEVKLLKDRLNAGTRALPLLIIEDVLNNLGGKTLTITNGTYTHTVGFPQGESILPITLECLGDWSVSYTDNGNTVTKTATVDKVGGVTFSFLKIVSWSSGSDNDIVDMVTAADEGIITLSDYWNVGDERTVHLDAMSATGVNESHAAQDVTFILLNVGDKTLVTPTESGRTECSFITGLKDCLNEKGYMNSTATTNGSWSACARRTWCNSVFKNAMPSTLLPIFKQFQNITAATYNGSTNQTTDDWFALAAQAEIFKGDPTYGTGGTAGKNTAYSNLTEFNALSVFTYYETAANRVKKVNGNNDAYSARSPHYQSSSAFCMHDSVGANGNPANNSYGIAPFGVI